MCLTAYSCFHWISRKLSKSELLSWKKLKKMSRNMMLLLEGWVRSQRNLPSTIVSICRSGLNSLTLLIVLLPKYRLPLKTLILLRINTFTFWSKRTLGMHLADIALIPWTTSSSRNTVSLTELMPTGTLWALISWECSSIVENQKEAESFTWPLRALFAYLTTTSWETPSNLAQSVDCEHIECVFLSKT